MIDLAIFASGNGTNAENLIRYFQYDREVNATLVVSNKIDAPVLQRAKNLNTPAYTFSKNEFEEGTEILKLLDRYNIDFIVLAGFLLKISDPILEAYPNRIINIHPSLLPKYGGKGMYGGYVHQAVVNAGETESGITIHYVDEKYDNGSIIFQAVCEVSPDDSADDLAAKIHRLEQQYFPKVVRETAIKQCR